MKFVTKRMQINLHAKYTYYRGQNLSASECHRYALRDLGLPDNFNINEYTVTEDDDARATDNHKDFKGLRLLDRVLKR